MAVTQLRTHGPHTGARYGSFAGRGAGAHPVDVLTQARGYAAFTGKRYGSFAGRVATPTERLRLTQLRAYGAHTGQRYKAFSGKTEAPTGPTEEVLGGARGGVTGYAAETSLDFDRVSRRRIKRAVAEAVADTGLSLTEVEAFVVEQSLRAFLASGAKRTTNAVQRFVTDTIASLQRADLERRAASQQFAEDKLEAVAQQRRDNRRRAVILVILLMLS